MHLTSRTSRTSLHFRPAPLALAIALALAVPATVQAQAAAANASVNLALNAQPLAAALGALSAATGTPIGFSPALVAGKMAPAVSGTLTEDQALSRVLSGSGLIAVREGSGIVIIAAPANQGVTTMQAVTVSGKAPGSTTEGTGSYTTWSTSSSTRLNLTPQETPQSVTVMTRQRIEDQRLGSLIDVLDAAVGITMKQFSVGSDSPQMWARGSSITNFQIDGVPVASSMSNYLQNTAMYDRVEIVKGATGIMSGLGSPAATINMIRKRPTAEPQTSITAEAGSWQRYGSGVDISRPLNADASVRGRLVADYRRDGAWIDNYRQDYGVLYGIGEMDLGDRTLLTAGFSHTTRNTDAPIRAFYEIYSNGQPTGAGLSAGASPDWAYYDHELNSVFGSVEHRFGSGWSAKAELTHGRYKYDSFMASPVNLLDQATGVGSAQLIHWASEVEQTSLDAYVTGPFTLLGRNHELIAGVTVSSLEQDSPSYPGPRVTLNNAFNWANELSKPTAASTGNTKAKEFQYSAYLNSRLQLSSATSLLLGSRVINWKQDRDSLSYSTGNVSSTNLRERNILVPYAGLVHALDDTYSVYASYTKIFNPQPPHVVDIRGNTLDPEEGTSYEVGIKGSFKDGLINSSLSVFRTQQDTFPEWDATTRSYTAINDIVTEGVEAEVAGELARGWQVGAGYTYGVTRNKDGLRLMTRIPKHTVKLSTTYRLPGDWNKLTLGGSLHWESKTGDPLVVYTQPSYTVLNLMARYQVDRQLSLAAHLNNALDKRYLAAVSDTRGVYGAPRNFMLSMKYTF
ncbi:TonB-dependent siderophore receptor [Pigmentiphaga aceris]|uniref:TonB-dependent siderophore receptor n=1 Tax=Pigmentiphaga aceris TaxID=1940612 RepID=A0A5C0B272_9BURK|nr:TonB-dependent receptor [Pigmentiphaga aceris]QEI06697.1 TonB-dependent siderophore receptor [Pigmentiphaga aceris]